MENEQVEIKDPKAVLDALERAKNDAKRYREERDHIQTSFDSINDQFTNVQKSLINEKINSKLNSLGVSNSERFSSYIDMEKVSVNEFGEVDGVDDQIAKIRSDFPELFDPKRIVGGRVNSAESQEVKVQKDLNQIQADYLLGRI